MILECSLTNVIWTSHLSKLSVLLWLVMPFMFFLRYTASMYCSVGVKRVSGSGSVCLLNDCNNVNIDVKMHCTVDLKRDCLGTYFWVTLLTIQRRFYIGDMQKYLTLTKSFFTHAHTHSSRRHTHTHMHAYTIIWSCLTCPWLKGKGEKRVFFCH